MFHFLKDSITVKCGPHKPLLYVADSKPYNRSPISFLVSTLLYSTPHCANLFHRSVLACFTVFPICKHMAIHFLAFEQNTNT
jgi:hypothetical protein